MAGMSSFAQSVCRIVVCTVLGISLLFGQDTLKADSDDRPAETLRKQKEKVSAARADIERSKKTLQHLEAREGPLDLELERLNRELNASRRAEKGISDRLKDLKQQLETQTTRLETLERDIRVLEEAATKRLVALYKLGALGVAPFIFSCHSFSEFLQKQRALEEVSRHDSDLWRSLQDKRRSWEALSRQLNGERQVQQELLAKQQRERATIRKRKADLDALLAAIRADKRQTREYMEALKASAERLEETLRELKARRAEGGHQAPPSTGAFLAAKGMLPRPVNGEVIEAYGAYDMKGHYGVKGFRSGVRIQAEPGTPVKTVHDGEVVYAGRLRGYGNIVIVDHGDHYYTLSAQLAEFFKKPADRVSAGDVIGTSGGIDIHGRPGIYFEIRHHGTPLNPTPWLSRR